MDFLNKAFAQVRELFQSMTPGARITAGLLLIVIVISLGYLFVHGVSGPNTYLMDGTAFTPKELDTMEAAFAKAGLSEYVREGGRVRVPRSKQIAYMAALADADALPRDFGATMENAYRSANPFQPKEQMQGIVSAAKQRMVSQIISSMAGIENAYVMYDSHTEGGLHRKVINKATVFVKPAGNKNLEASLANSIRKVMPWAGLEPKNVAVIDMNTGKTVYGDETEANNDLDRQRTLEQQYRSNILDALAYVPGVTVSCNVELADERVYRAQEVKHEPKTVPQQITETSKSRTSDGGSTGGPVGYSAQGNKAVSLGNSAGKGLHEEEEENKRQEYNLVSTKSTEVERIPTPIKRVTASVVVPNSYFGKLWDELNPSEPGKERKPPTQNDLDQIRKMEIDKIRALVANLLPRAEGVADPLELVAVTAFQDLKMSEAPVAKWHESALSWLSQSWSTVGVLALAIFSLLMLRSMVRWNPVVPVAAPSEATAAAMMTVSGEEETAEAKAARRFPNGEQSVLDELSEMVGNDPDTAASILRSWIGNVG